MQLAVQAGKFAKEHKLLSRGLGAASNAVSNKTLKKLLGGAGKVASLFGLANQAQFRRSRNKKGNRGSGRGGRGPRGASVGSTGQTLKAASAPIQMARTDEIKPFFNIYPMENGCIVHGACQVAQSAAIVDTTFTETAEAAVIPAATAYPWLSTYASLWKKFQLKNLRLHYQHYESTVVPGEVILKYTPDPDEPLATETEEEIGNSSNFVRGAVYEDFMMEADLSGLPKIPLDTDFASEATDLNDIAAGKWAVYGNHYHPEGETAPWTGVTLPGNIYVEIVMEFHDRNTPAAEADPARLMRVLRSTALRREEKLQYVEFVLDHLEDRENKRKQEKLKDRTDPVVKRALATKRVPSATLKRA
jgi:hypothetical protein